MTVEGLEITPGRSVGAARFGMSEKEVQACLGTPDSRFDSDEDGDVVLAYRNGDLQLTFPKDDEFRLGMAELLRLDHVELAGRDLPGNESGLVARLVEVGLELPSEPRVVGGPDGQRVYETPDSSVTAFFGPDRQLRNLSLGPKVDLDSQEVRWPWLRPMLRFGQSQEQVYPYLPVAARAQPTSHARYRRLDSRMRGALDGSGEYRPNHFILCLGMTDSGEGMNSQSLLEQLDPVFVHEYLHYWHNISTFSGIYFMTFHQSVAALFSKTLGAGDGSSDGALLSRDSDHLLGLTRLRERMEGEAAPPGITDEEGGRSWRVTRVEHLPTKIPLKQGSRAAPADAVRLEFQSSSGVSTDMILGTLAIEESVVAILERQVWRHHGEEPDELPMFPYGVIEAVAEYVVGDRLPADAIERERVVATLGTLSLLVPQHSRNLVGLFELYRDRVERTADSALAGLVDMVQQDYNNKFSKMIGHQSGEFEKMHASRGAVGLVIPVLTKDIAAAQAKRQSDLTFDLDLFYPHFSEDRFRKHILQFLPCDVLMERDAEDSPRSDKPQTDELYTFTGGLSELAPGVPVSAGFRALQAQQEYVFAHINDHGDGFCRSAQVEASCPFYSSCDLKPRVEDAQTCARRPWRHFRASGDLCWFASGVLATLGTAEVRGKAEDDQVRGSPDPTGKT